MTTTIRDINELQDRRIMMEKKLPPFGYALILLTAALILFLVVWSTKNYRTYVSQSSGSDLHHVQLLRLHHRAEHCRGYLRQ